MISGVAWTTAFVVRVSFATTALLMMFAGILQIRRENRRTGMTRIFRVESGRTEEAVNTARHGSTAPCYPAGRKLQSSRNCKTSPLDTLLA